MAEVALLNQQSCFKNNPITKDRYKKFIPIVCSLSETLYDAAKSLMGSRVAKVDLAMRFEQCVRTGENEAINKWLGAVYGPNLPVFWDKFGIPLAAVDVSRYTLEEERKFKCDIIYEMLDLEADQRAPPKFKSDVIPLKVQTETRAQEAAEME